MIQRKEIPGIKLPEKVEWQNPTTFSLQKQLQILKLSLKEPFAYKSDFSCLGNWKGICGKEKVTKSCILRGFCHFWQNYCRTFAYSELLMRYAGPAYFSYCKEVWRKNVDRVWPYFVQNFLLRKWAVLFYDCDEEKDADLQIRRLSEKEDTGLLLNLEEIAGRLIEKDPIRINLGRRSSWENEEKILSLTLEKDFVFGITGIDEEVGIGRQLHAHRAIMFLLALKWFKFRVKEDQLTSHSLTWFFHLDSDNQVEWIGSILPEIREKPAKLIGHERRNPLGPALRYFRDNFTSEALQLTTLCFEAKGCLEGPFQEEFSFDVLERVYELEKLAQEGRIFWDGWKNLLYRHIGDILSGLVHYSPKGKKISLSPEWWFDSLKPHKQAFWNFLFFLKEEERTTILEAIRFQLEFLARNGNLGQDGAIQARPQLSAYNYGGLRENLKSLASFVFA